MAVVKTKSVKIRKHRRYNVLTIRETFVSDGQESYVTWESSSLREALNSILNSKEPGYELDIKLRV